MSKPKRPVVIVDPLSAGIELAPAFQARGTPTIAVTLESEPWPEFGSRLKASDFDAIFPAGPDLENLLAPHQPLAIIPGTEEAIPLADHLTRVLTPQFANAPEKSRHRTHKFFMQQALAKAGVPSLKTLHTACETQATTWLAEESLQNVPLILKPPCSSGSELVFHIAAGRDWRKAFRQILQQPSIVSGKRNETVVLQEQAIGTEYAVGTVSANGKHSLAHLMKYTKTSAGGRRTVFDHVEFVPFDREVLGDLFEYTQRALNALGIRWGATHTEIMLTSEGPRLIEASPRLIGGPVAGFARAATGSSQVDKLVSLFVDGEERVTDFVFQKTVVPVFLKAYRAGVISNLEIFDRTAELPTRLSQHFWVKNGDRVPQTVDYLTAIGIVALAGERDSIFADYRRLRAIESGLIIEE